MVNNIKTQKPPLFLGGFSWYYLSSFQFTIGTLLIYPAASHQTFYLYVLA
jgi:hypothetical protein